MFSAKACVIQHMLYEPLEIAGAKFASPPLMVHGIVLRIDPAAKRCGVLYVSQGIHHFH